MQKNTTIKPLNKNNMRIDDINKMADADIIENRINKLAEEYYKLGYNAAQKDLYTKQDLIDLVDSLKNYTKESHTILGHDDRDAIEFVDIFLNEISDKKRNFVFSDDQDIESKNIIGISDDKKRINKFNAFISTEVALKFLTKEQGERLKWYYETYLANEIQGDNK